MRRWLLAAFAVVLVVGSIPGAIRFGRAYTTARLEMSPYRTTIEILQSEATPGAAVLLNSYDHRTYDWLYPYLWRKLSFYMLDDYAPASQSVEERTRSLLNEVAEQHQEWWMFDNDPDSLSAPEKVLAEWLATHGQELGVRDVNDGRLYQWQVRP